MILYAVHELQSAGIFSNFSDLFSNRLKFPIARASNALIRERKRRLRDAFIQRQQLEKLRRQQIMTGRTPEKTLIEHIGMDVCLITVSKRPIN